MKTIEQNKLLDIIQWVIICFLMLVCVGHSLSKCSRDKKDEIELRKEQAYIKIYDSQNIKQLKEQNKALHDSIDKLKNAESGIEIKYVYKYVTDTIRVDRFVYNENDSVYHYVTDNDTISCEFDVKAQQLEWVKNKFTVNDKFMIINREKDGENQLIINHSPNVEIENVDAWHRPNNKNMWYNNFHFGIQAGYGYGIINHKPDLFIGVGVTYVIK